MQVAGLQVDQEIMIHPSYYLPTNKPLKIGSIEMKSPPYTRARVTMLLDKARSCTQDFDSQLTVS